VLTYRTHWRNDLVWRWFKRSSDATRPVQHRLSWLTGMALAGQGSRICCTPKEQPYERLAD
jgi:hypothetical protein